MVSDQDTCLLGKVGRVLRQFISQVLVRKFRLIGLRSSGEGAETAIKSWFAVLGGLHFGLISLIHSCACVTALAMQPGRVVVCAIRVAYVQPMVSAGEIT